MPAAATSADALRYLMQRNSLRQIDLPELGSQVWCPNCSRGGAISMLAKGKPWQNGLAFQRFMFL